LHFFAPLQFLGAPATPGRYATLAQVKRSLHKDQSIALAILAGFYQQWRIPDKGWDSGLAGQLLHKVLALTKYHRVQKRFQTASILRVGRICKNTVGNGMAIYRSVGLKDTRPPPAHQCLANVRVVVSPTDEVVGGDDGAAELGEEIGDESLAGADSAEQAYDRFAVKHGFIAKRKIEQ
jgi:hypothetical protein